MESHQLMAKLKDILENKNIMDSQTIIYGIPQVKETIAVFYEEQGIYYDGSRFIMERYRKELLENARCGYCVPMK